MPCNLDAWLKSGAAHITLEWLHWLSYCPKRAFLLVFSEPRGEEIKKYVYFWNLNDLGVCDIKSPKTVPNDSSQDNLCMVPFHLEPGWTICNQWSAVELTLHNFQAESCRTPWLWFLGTFIPRLSIWNPGAILWKVHATTSTPKVKTQFLHHLALSELFGPQAQLNLQMTVVLIVDLCLQSHVSPQARTTQLNPVNLQSHKRQR